MSASWRERRVSTSRSSPKILIATGVSTPDPNDPGGPTRNWAPGTAASASRITGVSVVGVSSRSVGSVMRTTIAALFSPEFVPELTVA